MASMRKGDNAKRAQKYQNAKAFKAGLYGASRRVKLAAAAPLAGICARCKDKIEWKKKYDKYKPLTAPKKCVLCEEKKVKQAYYRLCQDCAEGRGLCAKCGEEKKIESSFPMGQKEKTQEEAEFRRGLKLLTERERRKLLREQLKETKSSDRRDRATPDSSTSDGETSATEGSEGKGSEDTQGSEGKMMSEEQQICI